LIVQEVKVSVLNYMYPLLFAPAEFLGVSVADPRDIACMKITAIASRGSKRDFVNLNAASERFSLSELIKVFSRKHARVGYSRLHVLKSLTYFVDAEKDPMLHMLVQLEWQPSQAILRKGSPATRIKDSDAMRVGPSL